MRVQDKLCRQLGVTFAKQKGDISQYWLNNNGLKILFCEDHNMDGQAAVVQHVHVGSRHEHAGTTGFAHLLEHMLFKGTPNHNPSKGNSYDDIMKRLGGTYNATTWFDRTNYFAKIPAHCLDLYYELEADRLRNTILRDEDLATEMPVVVDEFDIGENDPDEAMEKLLYGTAYVEHQYKVSTIGSRSEVMKVTCQRLKDDLYDVYYWPNNVTLITVGDFDTAEALAMIVKHYGHIPRSPASVPQPYTVEPPQEGERRFVISRQGDLPRVLIGYHVPEATHQDTFPLAVMSQVLGGSKSSRLYRALVNNGLASRMFAYHREQHDPGLFIIGATLTPGTTVENVEQRILAEVEKIATGGISEEELRRAKRSNRLATTHQRVNSLSYAKLISENEATADWEWGVDYDAHFDAVTVDQVKEAAQRYFEKRNRTVGHFIPAEEAAEPAKGAAAVPVQVTLPKRERRTYAEQTIKAVLPNGLTLLVLPRKGPGLVGVSASLSAGDCFASKEKSLVAHWAAALLAEGSKRYSKEKLAELAEELRASFQVGTNDFFAQVNTNVASEDLSTYLDALADVLQNPLYTKEEVELYRTRLNAHYTEALVDPASMARQGLYANLYSKDSVYYAKPFKEVLDELATIGAEDLRAFHAEHYTPKSMILTLVGDVDVESARKLVEEKFGHWTGGEPKPVVVQQVEPPKARKRLDIHIPDKNNISIYIGLPADVTRLSPHYFAARLANAALGRDTLSARLGLEVRERNGLTYGIVSRFMDFTYGGAPWLIALTTSPDKVERALGLIEKVVAQYVQEGISAEELDAEKDRAVNELFMQLDTPVNLASTITLFEQTKVGVGALDSFEASIRSVSADEVNQAIRMYFLMDNCVTVVAGSLKS